VSPREGPPALCNRLRNPDLPEPTAGVKLAPHPDSTASHAQLGEHSLHAAARGCVTGVEVAGVLAADLDQPTLTLLSRSISAGREAQATWIAGIPLPKNPRSHCVCNLG
jgi:hypothetical protein